MHKFYKFKRVYENLNSKIYYSLELLYQYFEKLILSNISDMYKHNTVYNRARAHIGK